MVSHPVPRVDDLNRYQWVRHQEVVYKGGRFYARVSHQQGCDHADLVAEWEEIKQTLYQVQQRIEYPVGCPMSELLRVLPSLPVVPQVEESFIYRNDEPAQNVYDNKE